VIGELRKRGYTTKLIAIDRSGSRSSLFRYLWSKKQMEIQFVMTSVRWQAIAKIFEAALEKSQAERRKFVQDACAGDSELESEVAKLLAADEAAGSFLEGPALGSQPPRSTLHEVSPLLTVGSLVCGRFEIVRFIGQGGMGQVYEAFDHELKGRVALKAIRPDISTDSRTLSRFRREVQLTRRITHPNVCRTFDIERHVSALGDGVESDITFLTMELLEGETLAEWLCREGPLAKGQALPLVLQMVEALNAAHSVSIVHRDFKPSNIVLIPSKNGRRLVVTDFGLACAVLREGSISAEQVGYSLSGSEALMGTLVYMAPEQLERGESTIASDIYSLGLVMYEMVTGRRPFADSIPFAEAVKRIKQPAPSPKLISPYLEPVWEATICKCLEAEPGDRFETARAVADSLSDARPAIVSSPARHGERVESFPRSDQPWTGRHRVLAVAACSLLLLSLLGVFLRHYIRRKAPIQFAERDWILVTDFSNQTGENVFDRVARDLTVESLSQSNYVNVVPRLTALEAAKRTGLKDINFIDYKLGREICLRENYKALLSGNISKQGSRYVLDMKVEVPTRDSSTISDSEIIQSPDEIFAGVDRLSVRIRGALGESFSRIETNAKPLARVTTPSLEALQRYSTALDLYGAREYTRSVALANDAVDRDPNFAMAHLLLARAYEQMGDEARSRQQLAYARSGLDHVSEREKHLILAADYSNQLLNEKAAQEYQHLLDIFPDDVDALKGYAYEAFWAGHSDQAIMAQRRALTLSPSDADCYDTLMTLLLRTNRFGEALAVYGDAQSHQLKGPNLNFLAALSAWGEGDLMRTRLVLDSLGEESSSYWKVVSRLFVGKLLAFQGRMTESIEAFRTGLALVETPGFENWIPTFQYQIARAEIVRADMQTARIECRRYRKTAEKVPTPINFERGTRLALQVGDIQSSKYFQALARRQVALHPDSFSEMELHSLKGDIALELGDAAEAAQEQQSALTFRRWYTPYFSLGEACEAQKNWKCAITAYTQYLGFEGAILRDDAGEDWVLAHYSLARVYFKSGDRASGQIYYQRFMSLLSDADPNLPILLQAKHETERWNATQ
jgi:eukaryotic-like serine/threonine-protein kinase